jgi:hypothetical protein
MTKLFIGHKPSVGAVVKVMANNTDDPLTTPNTDYSKFRFNSETGKIGYIYDTSQRTSYNTATYPNLSKTIFNGTTLQNAQEILAVLGNTQLLLINLTKKYNLGYNPIFEVKIKKTNGRFTKQSDTYTEEYGTVDGPFGTRSFLNGWLTFSYSRGGAMSVHRDFTNGYLTQNIDVTTWSTKPTYMGLDYFIANNPSSYIGNSSDRFGTISLDSNNPTWSYLAVVWDLPADQTPLQSPGPYVANQTMVELSPTTAKVAMPGFSIGSATRRQLIIDSNRVPAKIIKTGDITIGPNSSSIVSTNPAFPLTGNVYVDYTAWISGQAKFVPSYTASVPADWSNAEIVIDYDVQTNSVRFYNVGPWSVVVRYMIIGDDDVAQSSGGGKVLETGADFQRILRPGSNSNNPALSDILLDTRLSYLPILAEGYEPFSNFVSNTVNPGWLGSWMKTVNFSNGGMKPFPKISVKYDDGSFRPPHLILSTTGTSRFNYTVTMMKQSALCEFTDTSITFRCNPGGHGGSNVTNGKVNVYYHNWYDGGYTTSYAKPVGFRYYILGLPI